MIRKPIESNRSKSSYMVHFGALWGARGASIAGLLLFALVVPLHGADAPASQRANILYIMSDDHASHALSCYGSKINQTPNLDRLAAAGMRFTNCFVTDSLCGPSRAVLLTGKYNHLNGFRDNS